MWARMGESGSSFLPFLSLSTETEMAACVFRVYVCVWGANIFVPGESNVEHRCCLCSNVLWRMRQRCSFYRKRCRSLLVSCPPVFGVVCAWETDADCASC